MLKLHTWACVCSSGVVLWSRGKWVRLGKPVHCTQDDRVPVETRGSLARLWDHVCCRIGKEPEWRPGGATERDSSDPRAERAVGEGACSCWKAQWGSASASALSEASTSQLLTTGVQETSHACSAAFTPRDITTCLLLPPGDARPGAIFTSCFFHGVFFEHKGMKLDSVQVIDLMENVSVSRYWS